MIRHSAALAALLLLPLAPAAGADELDRGQAAAACLEAAAGAYRVPPAVLLILLRVEGGTVGHVSRPNGNGTVDIGPMQVNEAWLPRLALHWNTSKPAAYAALRDDFCANLEGGAWILRQAIDEAHGDLWEGVGRYHSRDAGYKEAYLRQVLSQAQKLQAAGADLRG